MELSHASFMNLIQSMTHIERKLQPLQNIHGM
jgi:hypothetical protein